MHRTYYGNVELGKNKYSPAWAGAIFGAFFYL